MNLPRVFSVGTAVKSGGSVGRFTAHGGGRLTVTPEAIVLEPRPLTKGYTKVERLVHSGRSIVMLKGWLLPLFINTRLVIEDGDVVAMASLPGWSRRRLREAIREAGFELQEPLRLVELVTFSVLSNAYGSMSWFAGNRMGPDC